CSGSPCSCARRAYSDGGASASRDGLLMVASPPHCPHHARKSPFGTGLTGPQTLHQPNGCGQVTQSSAPVSSALSSLARVTAALTPAATTPCRPAFSMEPRAARVVPPLELTFWRSVCGDSPELCSSAAAPTSV